MSTDLYSIYEHRGDHQIFHGAEIREIALVERQLIQVRTGNRVTVEAEDDETDRD